MLLCFLGVLFLCTYQKLIEKQETKIANKYWRNYIGYGLGVTP